MLDTNCSRTRISIRDARWSCARCEFRISQPFLQYRENGTLGMVSDVLVNSGWVALIEGDWLVKVDSFGFAKPVT